MRAVQFPPYERRVWNGEAQTIDLLDEGFEGMDVNANRQRISSRRTRSDVILHSKRSRVKDATDPSDVSNAKLQRLRVISIQNAVQQSNES